MQSMCQNNAVKKKCTMFLSKILTCLCMIIYYIVEEEILKRHIQDYFKGTL